MSLYQQKVTLRRCYFTMTLVYNNTPLPQPYQQKSNDDPLPQIAGDDHYPICRFSLQQCSHPVILGTLCCHTKFSKPVLLLHISPYSTRCQVKYSFDSQIKSAPH